MNDKVKKLINKLEDEPFEYGKVDCFTFTNALVKAWHGKDYWPLHNVYRSETEAQEYMEKYGGIEPLIIGTIGYPLKKPTDCVDGDVVTAMISPGEVALGFVINNKGLFKTKKRSISIPLRKCRMGWRIK